MFNLESVNYYNCSWIVCHLTCIKFTPSLLWSPSGLCGVWGTTSISTCVSVSSYPSWYLSSVSTRHRIRYNWAKADLCSTVFLLCVQWLVYIQVWRFYLCNVVLACTFKDLQFTLSPISLSLSLSLSLPLPPECLFSHRHSPPLLLPGLLHVDVDGGCGPVRGSCQSLHQEAVTLHCWFHHCQLWYVHCIRGSTCAHAFTIHTCRPIAVFSPV